MRLAHLVLGENTGAASAYVAMTRGRHHNTAHLVAHDPAEARAPWVTASTRDRTDLGPANARRLARSARPRIQPRTPRGPHPLPPHTRNPQPQRTQPE